MIQPVLYSFRRCPYAMRARMALWVSGQAVELREILLKDKPASMLEASPKGTVPVLDLGPEGGVIDESLAVMTWALERHDPLGWRPETDAEQAEMQALIERNDGPFKHHLDRYKYASRYEGEAAEGHRTAGAEILHDLDARLAARAQLFGERPRLADIALFPFIRQFRIADPGWFDAEPWPHLKTWLDGHMASALFQAVMEKYTVWQPGGPGVLFRAA